MLTQDPVAPLILVVEDDTGHAELIRRSFSGAPESYRLHRVTTIGEAESAMALLSPSLVLTDYRLPDGEGSRVVAMADRGLPVILMTSQGTEQVAVEAMKAGVLDYLVKTQEAFQALPGIVRRSLREWSLMQERKQADQMVRDAKQDWEQTFDAVTDLITVIDVNHNIIRANRAAAERLGLRPEDMVGQKCHQLAHGADEPPSSCPHAAMMRTGKECSEEFDLEERGIFHVTAHPLYDDAGRIRACVHVARDVTAQRRAEAERRDLETRFQQAQKLEALGVLAGGIAHDFNNILTIVLGHCFVVKEGELDGESRIHVQQIEDAANRAAELCRQMLAYAGRNAPVKSFLDVAYLVNDMVRMLKSAIAKNVTFSLRIDRLLPEIKGDTSQMQQIVMNLVLNAAEAIGDRNGVIGIVLEKRSVTVDGEADYFGAPIPAGDYVLLEVADTGCGMDRETRERIFEPFFTTKIKGRGLGLSAILGIVRNHAGALQLVSEQGAGTTFRVFLPIPAVADAVAYERTGTVPAPVRSAGTILLVDDEESIRRIVSAMLERSGYSVLTAENGLTALQLFREHEGKIDLVVLDLIMPEMGGAEAFRELRAIAPALPVLICSGCGTGEFADEIADDGHAGYMQKPYRPDLLREKIAALLQGGKKNA